MLASAVDVGPECIGQAEVTEMAAQPPGRARRGDRFGKFRGQRTNEVPRSDHRTNALTQRADALLLAALVELGREYAADAPLDRGDELRSGEADIMFDRFLDGGAMAEIGQQLREQSIALELAFEQHS